MLTELKAAYHLGITQELLFEYTRHPCGAEKRRLPTVEDKRQTYFDKAELDAFDRYLQEPWGEDASRKPPKWIENHLRVESGGRLHAVSNGSRWGDCAHRGVGEEQVAPSP